jgi:hypothetical protein
MLNIKRILFPVDFPNTSLGVVHQAATLAHHFHSEIVMLPVVTAQSHAAGVPEDGPEFAAWDVLTEITKGAQKTWTSLSGRSLMALPSNPYLSKASPPTPLCRRLRRKKHHRESGPADRRRGRWLTNADIRAEIATGVPWPWLDP